MWAGNGEESCRGSLEVKFKKKLTEIQISKIFSATERNPTKTLQELADKVKHDYESKYQYKLCIPSYILHSHGNYLHGRLITLKKAHVEFASMNNDENKTLRKSCVEKSITPCNKRKGWM